MSNLKFRDKSVMEYWNKFKFVSVGISIDDFGERGEYFRHGMKWEKVIENIRMVKEKSPHVVFSINCTVSLFNVNYLPELHAEAYKLGIIRLGDFFANLLVDPAEYRVQVLPLKFRQKVAKKLNDYMKKNHADHMSSDPKGFQYLNNSFQSVIKYLLSGEAGASVEEFNKITEKLDKIRNEDFASTYPELEFLKHPIED